MHINLGRRRNKAFSLVLALLFALICLLMMPLSGLAKTVTIHDQAQVLNVASVQEAGAKLPNDLIVYTTNTFQGDLDALNTEARSLLPDQQSIVIDIDTVHRNVSIQSGTSVSLSNQQAQNAVSAFGDAFHKDNKSDYTSATIAAIASLQGTLNHEQSSLTPVGIVVAIVLGFVLLGALIIIAVALGRRRGSGRGPWTPGGRDHGYRAHNTYTHTHTYIPSSTSSGGGSFGGGSTGGGAGGHF
ncbi:hypothetical protein KSD_62540 [Ktedonobacter sp. SOSP1-85]|uniref:hypothetical protein n=1 Tax=Ktedonobacter sp. SOSP1-85 TaxID=2778367 RepID=UPI001916A085|nr:hypothetical protein [Ktedonobacter sp. SOSP1-85]GHO78483.1 hypothetical protein KSD_62540 [Ktedonobacter sp. SOSP1-85]